MSSVPEDDSGLSRNASRKSSFVGDSSTGLLDESLDPEIQQESNENGFEQYENMYSTQGPYSDGDEEEGEIEEEEEEVEEEGRGIYETKIGSSDDENGNADPEDDSRYTFSANHSPYSDQEEEEGEGDVYDNQEEAEVYDGEDVEEQGNYVEDGTFPKASQSGLSPEELEEARAERRRSAVEKGLNMAQQEERKGFNESFDEDSDLDGKHDENYDNFDEDELAQLDEIEGRIPKKPQFSNDDDAHELGAFDEDDFGDVDTMHSTEQDLRDALAERQALRRTHAIRQKKVLQLWARDPNLQRTLQSLADGREGLLIPGYEDLDNVGDAHLDTVNEGAEPLQKLYYDKLDKLSRAWDQLDQRREQADATIDKLTSILDRHDERLVKLTDTFRLFKRATATEATHSSTQRKIDPQVLLSFEEREQKIDRDLAEARLRYINVTNYLAKLERSIKQKEELAGGLHAIDFEQLRVENATLHDQIEERSDHLHKLRKKTVATVQVLTHVREKLHFIRQKNKELGGMLEEGNSDVGALRDRVGKSKQMRDQLRADNAILKQKQGFIGSDRLVHDFESRKSDLVVLKNKVESLKGKYKELHGFVLAANNEISRANGNAPSSTMKSGNTTRGRSMTGINGANLHLPNVRR